MAKGNRSKVHDYGNFRLAVEWQRRGKWRLRTDLLPSFAAWLLMIGRRYERMIAGMEHRQTVASVPGLEESCRNLSVCIRNIQNLLDLMPVNFDDADWQRACGEVAELMRIAADSKPSAEVPGDQFEELLQVPTDGSNADRTTADVYGRVAPSQKGRDRRPGRKRGRSG